MGSIWDEYGPWAVGISVFVLFWIVVLVCCILLHRSRRARFAAQAAPSGTVPAAIGRIQPNNAPNAMAMSNAPSSMAQPPVAVPPAYGNTTSAPTAATSNPAPEMTQHVPPTHRVSNTDGTGDESIEATQGIKAGRTVSVPPEAMV